MDDKLSKKEKRDIIVKGLISSIPYVGGGLSTFIYDHQNEKRLKRLESFYEHVINDLKNIEKTPNDITANDSLAVLIEQINYSVEKEHREHRIKHLKNFFIKSLLNQTDDSNFDERSYFLDTLSSLTDLECNLLINLNNYRELIPITRMTLGNTDVYAVVGALGRLKNYGFSTTVVTGFQWNGQVESYKNESVQITNFGKKFVDFTLTSPF